MFTKVENTRELYEERRERRNALFQKLSKGEITEDEMMGRLDEIHREFAVVVSQVSVCTDWGIPKEEWDSLSTVMKSIIINMAKEADQYEYLRQELDEWVRNAP